jgi:hypothetical protein
LHAHSGGGQRRLAAGVAGTNDDEIEMGRHIQLTML